MTDKKLTNNEIIKALDEAELFLQNRVKDGQPIKLNEYDVGELRNISQTCAKAYDEINRLQTENENLKVENQSLRSAANSLKMHYEEAQAEIERLKKTEIEIDDFCRRLCRMRMLNGNAIASYEDLQNYIQQEKSEAVKEFAERIKELIQTKEFTDDVAMLMCAFVENIVKEMVGEDNAEM